MSAPMPEDGLVIISPDEIIHAKTKIELVEAILKVIRQRGEVTVKEQTLYDLDNIKL